MVEQQGAQSGKFFSTARPAGTSVQATRHDVAVARVLRTNGRIDSQDSSMEIADAQNSFTNETRVVGKNGGHE